MFSEVQVSPDCVVSGVSLRHKRQAPNENELLSAAQVNKSLQSVIT